MPPPKAGRRFIGPLIFATYIDVSKNSIKLFIFLTKFLTLFGGIVECGDFFNGVVPKWLRGRSAKPLSIGSIPIHASMGSKKSFYWENLEPEKLWYLVGLITSDGCLSGDNRHVDLTSKDFSLLKSLKQSLGIKNKITPKHNGRGAISFHIQIGSVSFYDFLKTVGLFPNKSLTLSRLEIPMEHFDHFLRGVIDGDGCIRRWIHNTNGCEQWSLRIYAGSESFLKWLRNEIYKIYFTAEKIHNNELKNRTLVLKYGKLASQRILSSCYNNPLALRRKKELAYRCINSASSWSKSKTICSNA